MGTTTMVLGKESQHITVHEVMEKYGEHGIDLHMLSIEFKKPLNSMIRHKVMEEMRNLEGSVREGYTNGDDDNGRISVEDVHPRRGTNSIDVISGVGTPGDTLSTTLFKVVINGVVVYENDTQVVAYAD